MRTLKSPRGQTDAEAKALTAMCGVHEDVRAHDEPLTVTVACGERHNATRVIARPPAREGHGVVDLVDVELRSRCEQQRKYEHTRS